MSYNDKNEWVEDPKLVELHALAKAIAKAMPCEKGQFGWEYDKKGSTLDHDHNGKPHLSAGARLSTPEGLSLYIARKSNGTHVEIKSSCPSHTTGKRQFVRSEACPDISCAISKGASGIARDIERRLLPELLRVAAATAKTVAEWDAHESAHAAAIERVRVTAGASRAYEGNKIYMNTHKDGDTIDVSANVRVDSGTSCRVKISCTPEQACALLVFLRNMK